VVVPNSDVLFPSDNEFGIPCLDLGRMATEVLLPVLKWGTIKRYAKVIGTYHFYTDDYKMTALWRDPSPVVLSGCAAAVEPNFSINEQMPRAVALNRIYQKRWIARWWQERGLPMFVDMNVSPRYAQDNLLGVPRGWKSYWTRGSEEHLMTTLEEYELACMKAGGRSIIFVVYGGGNRVQTLARRMNWIWIPEQIAARVGRYGGAQWVDHQAAAGEEAEVTLPLFMGPAQ